MGSLICPFRFSGGGAEVEWGEQGVRWGWGLGLGIACERQEEETAESRKRFQAQPKSSAKEREVGRQRKPAERASACEGAVWSKDGGLESFLWWGTDTARKKVPQLRHPEVSWGPAAGGARLTETNSSLLEERSTEYSSMTTASDYLNYKSNPWMLES